MKCTNEKMILRLQYYIITEILHPKIQFIAHHSTIWCDFLINSMQFWYHAWISVAVELYGRYSFISESKHFAINCSVIFTSCITQMPRISLQIWIHDIHFQSRKPNAKLSMKMNGIRIFKLEFNLEWKFIE